MTDQKTTPRTRPSARLMLLLAAVWVVLGALFKLLAGTPNDLPRLVQEFPLLKPVWTFRFAIGAELAVVSLALLRPRVGWIAISLLFLSFDFLLWRMMVAGEASCGCFGSRVTLAPWQMMAIDTALLLGIWITRPWSGFRKRPLTPAFILPVVVLLLALPWFPIPGFFQEAQLPAPTNGGSQDPVENGATGDWYRFEPADWEGVLLHDLDLIGWLEDPSVVDLVPPPANVIVYRLSCEECREHFLELQVEPITDRPIILIQVPEPDDASDVVTDVKPQDALYDWSLRELPRGYGVTTPVIFDVDEVYTVQNVIELEESDS